jgi:hypothetical protein
VREHPFATHEEGRLHAVSAQNIDDTALITGDLGGLLAHVERERDELLTCRQLDPAYSPALRNWGEFGQRALGRRNERVPNAFLHAFITPAVRKVARRPAQRRRCRTRGGEQGEP